MNSYEKLNFLQFFPKTSDFFNDLLIFNHDQGSTLLLLLTPPWQFYKVQLKKFSLFVPQLTKAKRERYSHLKIDVTIISLQVQYIDFLNVGHGVICFSGMQCDI